jgi:crotonobetainyl-CoA:carnitine CoA-transferase CaiB-like acyl-CoA transferase
MHDRDEITRQMAAQDIPVIPVLTPDEALNSPHAAERQLVRTVPHATEGKITELRNPLHPSGLARQDRTPAPELGADNAAILQRIGLSESEIAGLAKAGTI